MPPAALMSSTACSTPFLSWAPKAALPPVIGPATPSLTCAEAVFAPDATKAAATVSDSQNAFFMQKSPFFGCTQEPARTSPRHVVTPMIVRKSKRSHVQLIRRTLLLLPTDRALIGSTLPRPPETVRIFLNCTSETRKHS